MTAAFVRDVLWYLRFETLLFVRLASIRHGRYAPYAGATGYLLVYVLLSLLLAALPLHGLVALAHSTLSRSFLVIYTLIFLLSVPQAMHFAMELDDMPLCRTAPFPFSRIVAGKLLVMGTKVILLPLLLITPVYNLAESFPGIYLVLPAMGLSAASLTALIAVGIYRHLGLAIKAWVFQVLALVCVGVFFFATSQTGNLNVLVNFFLRPAPHWLMWMSSAMGTAVGPMFLFTMVSITIFLTASHTIGNWASIAHRPRESNPLTSGDQAFQQSLGATIMAKEIRLLIRDRTWFVSLIRILLVAAFLLAFLTKMGGPNLSSHPDAFFAYA